MGTTAFTNTCGITLSVNYVVDSYRDISGDSVTGIILIRNTMSFAIGYGITPWLNNLGTQNCFVGAMLFEFHHIADISQISVAFIGLGICSLFLVMIWKGKYFREKYRLKYWRLVQKHVDMDMLH